LIVGHVAATPLRFAGEFLSALAAADDQRATAGVLAAELRERLALDGVLIHEHRAGRNHTWAQLGVVKPAITPRIAAVRAGEPLADGFGYAAQQPPRWVVLCSRRRPPTDDEAAYLAMACDAATVAAAHAGRVRAERTAARTGRALAELGQALSLEHGEERVLHLLTLAVARLLRQEGVSAWQKVDGGFTLVSACGFTARKRPSVGARAAFAAVPADLTASRRLRVLTREQAPALVRGVMAAIAPIGERQGNHALLVVERESAPDAAEEALLLGVADQALLALENERLLEEQRAALSGTVACLGRALALRHRETAQHSDRLTSDCTAVGRALGVTGDQLRDLTFAAALHDLGKIGVPERVLGNAGPLDEEGWRVSAGHPELGAQIIDPVGALAGAAVLIRACHEHWDGRGYPLGLAGEVIPLGARVILVCDAYHAMCEERSYQPAMPPEAARERVRSLAGADFDPRVVDALMSHLDRLARDPRVA
jgi:HD-GYP domain-containing protein (c-di-GMP phosphodiesterase class II)